MIAFDSNKLAWEKMHGLLPVIVQNAKTSVVLMLGYMNVEALQQTLATQWVTFYSRSKNRLWVKGEESGHKLKLVDISTDCDQDSLLILAEPFGPTCHNGTESCFAERLTLDWSFIQQLQTTIAQRQQLRPENSYVAALFNAGASKIAQKVGEEAVEVALATLDKDDTGFCNEAADLLFHWLILLRARNINLADIVAVLKTRSP